MLPLGSSRRGGGGGLCPHGAKRRWVGLPGSHQVRGLETLPFSGYRENWINMHVTEEAREE